MIIRKISQVTTVILCAASLASADTIILTNGERLEGRVVREDGDNLVLEVKVTNTIRDERIVAKSDVKLIEKEKEDIKAFRNISDLVPTPPLLGVKAYEERIEKINQFIEKYPISFRVTEAEAMIETLNEELKVVEEGGIKLSEGMVSAEDYRANAYEYDAVVAGKRIDQAISRGEFLYTLRQFSEYEEGFGDAVGRDKLVERIQQVLAAYGSQIDSSISSFDSRMEKRQAGLASMSTDDRAQTERAIKQEQERLEENFQREKEARDMWITPDVNHLESLKEARKQVDREISRLQSDKRKQKPETPLGEAYREAWTKISEGIDDEKEEKAVFDKLKTNGMPEKYIEMLREHAGVSEE